MKTSLVYLTFLSFLYLVTYAADAVRFTLENSSEPMPLSSSNEARKYDAKVSGNDIFVKLKTDKVGDTYSFPNAMIGLEPNPSQTMLLISFGDGRFEVIDIRNRKKIHVPFRPQRKDTFPFGEWHWAGDTRLIGLTGDIKMRNGKPVPEEDNVQKSRVFVFDLLTKNFSEVEVDDREMGAFSIESVRGDRLELAPDHPRPNAKSKWFVVREIGK